MIQAAKSKSCFADNVLGSSDKKKQAYHDTPDFDALFAKCLFDVGLKP